MTTFGVDYAFYPWPSCASMRSAGVKFVVRYISAYVPNDTNGKNLRPAELQDLREYGFSVAVVAEEGESRMLGGYSAGVADAQHADAVVKALGMAGIPVYFACDFDATAGQQSLINAYLDGVASVIGRKRTGIYGGYYVIKRTLDAGKAAYAWQTYAWSWNAELRKTNWDARAQLRQYRNAVIMGGGNCDYDSAQVADYGQFPRPALTVPSASGWAYTAPRGLTARGGRTSVYLAWQAPAGTVPAFPAGSAAPSAPASYTVRVYDAGGKLLTTRTAGGLSIQIGSLASGRLHAYVWANGGPLAPAGTPMVYFNVG